MELISVICIAYNHAKYIRNCLDGIIGQKTDYEFKVIIHDDASTDGTTDIIREYIDRYPDLFIPIIQKENRYSKGENISCKYISPCIQGKYVAVCEGDDFWCDENKLQKQVGFLENNPQYSACVHNTLLVDNRNGSEKVLYENRDKDLTLQDVGNRGGSAYHTSSLVLRSEFYVLPDEFSVKGIGDYPRSIYLALNGNIHYIKDVMSVYRYCCEGSWTLRQSTDACVENYQSIITMLKNADEYSDFLFHPVFEKAIRNHSYLVARCNNDYPTIVEQYNDLLRQEKFRNRIALLIRYMKKRFSDIKRKKYEN